MEIRIEYTDGSTFITTIPNGNIANVTMCLANQHYVKATGTFDVPYYTYEEGMVRK